MRARSTTKSRSGNSTPPPRDVDLLESDQFLPAGELDELWEWFYNAFNDNIDPELIFVKIINSARNPYRHHIPVGYSTSGPQDLISLEHEDEVEQLKTVVSTLRSEISGKDQVISSLEASNRESERQWARELADKEKELEKREEELGVLRLKEKEFEAELTSRDERSAREKEDLVETTNSQKAEIVALSEKREELVALLQSLTKDQLHTAQLYREALERQQQITSVQDEKMKLMEEKLAATQTKLADKEKDLEGKQTSLLELHLLIESHDETLAQRLSEAEAKNLESRRQLISAVCKGLTKKSLTPSSIGLTDEEWSTNQDSPAPAPPQRGWTWRS